jgi:hypothetical protein
VALVALVLALILPGASAAATLRAFGMGALLFGSVVLFIVLVVGLVGWAWNRRRRVNLGSEPVAGPLDVTRAQGLWWQWLAYGLILAIAYLADGPRLAAFFAGYALGAAAAFVVARPFMAWAGRTMGMESPRP